MNQNLIKFYYKFIKGQLFIFISSFLVILTSWLLYLIFSPYMNKIFIERITNLEKNRDLYYVFFPLFLVFLSKGLGSALDRLYDYLWTVFISKFKINIRNNLMMYVQDHAYTFFNKNMTGAVAQRIFDVADQAEDIIDLFLPMLIPMLIGMIVTILLAIRIHIIFGLIFIAWFITIAIISGTLGLTGTRASKEASESFSELSGAINDSLVNYINVKIFSNPLNEKNYLDKFNNKYLLAERKALSKSFRVKYILNLNSSIYFMILFSTILYFYSRNRVSIGDFMLLLNFYNSFDHSVNWISLATAKAIRNIGITKGHLNFLLEPHGILNKRDASVLDIKEGDIEFKDVRFNHNEKELFKHLNLCIKGGSKIGLIGASGAGKSTLIKLILRLYDLQEGSIEIDNQDISNLTQESLRKNISYVTQEPLLFNRTVLENISYGKEDSNIEDIKEAASKANCDFIESLENKYETLVGERGSNLSGGQKQRIAIARAILKNAPILLLDEATSALDSESEFLIQKSLENLMQNKTVIAIAHRLSTISSLDKLIVLKEGKVVEIGSHNELLEKKGYYHSMWSMQTNGFITNL